MNVYAVDEICPCIIHSHNQFKLTTTTKKEKKKKKMYMSNLGTIWYSCLATCFQFLNNITCSSTHFFAHKYFKKIQTTLLKQCYQTAHCYLVMSYPFSNALGPIYYCWNLEAIAQLASEVCQFRHGATSRWTGLPGLFILLCSHHKLQVTTT